MPKYNVVGEYGPQGWQAISREIEAENVGHARNQFQEIMETEHPAEWTTMGRRNVNAYELNKPAPQTVYEIRYKNLPFGDMIRAHDFWDAVEVAKSHCHERNIPMSDVSEIRYVMY
jgi:hypothetical protein